MSFSSWVAKKREARRRSMDEKFSHSDGMLDPQLQRVFQNETKALLAALPGFCGGRLDHIAETLLSRKRQSMDSSSEVVYKQRQLRRSR
jgi:hypothetical protein